MNGGNGERSSMSHIYRETLLDAENKGAPRLTAVKIYVSIYIYAQGAPTTYMYVVLGIATRPFTLKRGFGLQFCPPSSTSTAMKMPHGLSLRRYRLVRRCTTGNLHPSSAVSFPVPAYGFHSDCPIPYLYACSV